MALNDVRNLNDQWIATWTHLRGIEASELDGWPLVHVGSPSRETELVCVEPGVDRFLELMRHIDGDPRAMLTVAAHDVGPYLTAPRPASVRLDRDDEALMSTHLVDLPVPPLEADLTFRWDVDDHSVTYTLESGTSVAANGTVAVLGQVATFDRIETTPAFQRRGLGRHVMATLTAQAMGRGATHGVLAASAQGRPLYTSLGWQTRLEMLSLMGA
ncbi:GNAT family N-acetyltransferase [Aeromicrobium wangtongii]|uniref:GNAT family N-acetyltransferase n=1 Tax=Aeromicrobium wangtongii TaxID=2969247 RepID=A0ABY5MCT9_9ACTN|nr:GNAT family N-acetyltransferase [Aeromicrobium wangtongii]MCD9197450.1 GNAT family N-acetyltransferase [Aeromicrobium wangtongii]UUP14943.1 GNAT family N-acetyltransferase [Aeromicrobium wangtongii]